MEISCRVLDSLGRWRQVSQQRGLVENTRRQTLRAAYANAAMTMQVAAMSCQVAFIGVLLGLGSFEE
jgi:hypothetical protein